MPAKACPILPQTPEAVMTERFDVFYDAEAADAVSALNTGCFGHPAWAKAVAAARGRTHRFVSVRASRDGLADAWLVGAVHRRWGLSVFESMPMGGYGGWVGERSLSEDEERDLTGGLLRQSPWHVVEITCRPGRDGALPVPTPSRLWPHRIRERLAPRRFSTHLLDLSGDDATMLRRTRQSVRSYLRRADELGFEFERADDERALKNMHDWYCRGSQEWRQRASVLLPVGFFTAFAGCGFAEVWTVRFRAKVVGAALFLVRGDAVQYQASGTERIEAPLSATDAVIWAAARHYHRRGFLTMNLGASEGLDGVARFKKKFGAEAVSYLKTTHFVPALSRPGLFARVKPTSSG
jgi:hypothetical protein